MDQSWFGSFYMNDANAWVMHSELGWLYPMASGKAGFGFGRISWVGCGRINSSIHFCIKILPRAGFISTEQARIVYCSTIIAMNAGLNGRRELRGNEFSVL